MTTGDKVVVALTGLLVLWVLVTAFGGGGAAPAAKPEPAAAQPVVRTAKTFKTARSSKAATARPATGTVAGGGGRPVSVPLGHRLDPAFQ